HHGNPKYRGVLGKTCYATLRAVPHHIDIVDIFRNVEAIPAIVDESIAVNAGCVWMQLGLAHNEAASKARAAGLKVVMNHCTKIEHGKLPKD
ncbi:MAG TPA: CoA-binding protein, partial [Syntrophobacteraceae bacterium]|nr:CoA-binding protein [Syntrophobacteraceae bacterium]